MAATDHPFAFYGTLMSGQSPRPGQPHQFDAHLAHQAACLIPGRVYDTGRGFPALVAPRPPALNAEELVCGELCQVASERGVALLDQWEGPLFERRLVRLARPQLTAWVYCWTGATTALRQIPAACWREHARALTETECAQAAHPPVNESAR